jgi:hypothetical protein
MEATQSKKLNKFAFHWTPGSTGGLLMMIQAILCIVLMSSFMTKLTPSFVGLSVLLVFQGVYLALGIWLFIDSTFLRKNASRIGTVLLGIILAIVYVILLMVFAVITRNNRLAYIDANPGDFNSQAAISTAIAEAHTLCTKQLIFFGLSLPFVIAMVPLSVIKALDGEARTPYYVCFGLSIAFVFFGMYANVNLLEILSQINASTMSQMVESRSIVAYIAILGYVSLNSDFDPDEGKAPVKDF